jgi:hypothetical protein
MVQSRIFCKLNGNGDTAYQNLWVTVNVFTGKFRASKIYMRKNKGLN